MLATVYTSRPRDGSPPEHDTGQSAKGEGGLMMTAAHPACYTSTLSQIQKHSTSCLFGLSGTHLYWSMGGRVSEEQMRFHLHSTWTYNGPLHLVLISAIETLCFLLRHQGVGIIRKQRTPQCTATPLHLVLISRPINQWLTSLHAASVSPPAARRGMRLRSSKVGSFRASVFFSFIFFPVTDSSFLAVALHFCSHNCSFLLAVR